MQEHVMSDEMKLFFGKLVEFKNYTKERGVKTKGAEHLVWVEVWERLDEIIKEKQ